MLGLILFVLIRHHFWVVHIYLYNAACFAGWLAKGFCFVGFGNFQKSKENVIMFQLILHLVQNHLGGLSKIVLHGNKVKKSTVDAIKTYLRENHMDTESESTTSDLDLTLSSMTSVSTSDNLSHKQVHCLPVNCYLTSADVILYISHLGPR